MEFKIRKYIVSIPFFLFGIYGITMISEHWAFGVPGVVAFMFGILNYNQSKTMEEGSLI